MTCNPHHSPQAEGSLPPAARENGAGGRKPWSTPLVIVSEARLSQAHVYTFTDGTSIGGYRYGS